MSKLNEYFQKISGEISEGMKPGAYEALKNKYPKFFKEINEKLDNDFTHKGMDEYKTAMVRGFKKEGLWDDKK